MKKISLFSKEEWKNEISKSDLLSVIINGLVFAIIGGIFAGALEYLLDMLNFYFSFSLMILVALVGLRLRKSYDYYHILYPVLAVVFLLLGIFTSSLTKYFFLGNFSFVLFTEPMVYYYSLIAPVIYIKLFINTLQFSYLLYGILNLVIYVWAIIYVYVLVKGRN